MSAITSASCENYVLSRRAGIQNGWQEQSSKFQSPETGLFVVSYGRADVQRMLHMHQTIDTAKHKSQS